MLSINGLVINEQMLNLVAGLDEFKGAWRAVGFLAPERLAALRRVAGIQSVGSTRMEGGKLTDEAIENLVVRLKSRSFHTQDEQDAAGYAELLQTILAGWKDIPFTEDQIRWLHAELLKYSLKDEKHRGEYKTFNNHVEAYDQHGKSLGVVLRTASPFETSGRMTELMQWMNGALQGRKHHPLLIIAIFVVIFLEIHPFQHGNGRLSRLLTTLLLLQAGYQYVPYSSLEAVMEQTRESYYQSLRRTQVTIRAINPDWVPWTMYFLKALQLQKENLEHKLDREKIMQQKLPGLSLQILDVVKGHGRINITDAVTVTEANRNTVKKHLQQLVGGGYLIKNGVGKSTWYTLV